MYGFLVFPVSIGFFIHIFVVVVLQEYRQIDKDGDMKLFEYGIILFSFVTSGIVFIGEWKYLIVHKATKGVSYKDHYVSIYLTYILMNTILIILSILENISYPIHCLSAIQLIYLIILILTLPYK